MATPRAGVKVLREGRMPAGWLGPSCCRGAQRGGVWSAAMGLLPGGGRQSAVLSLLFRELCFSEVQNEMAN